MPASDNQVKGELDGYWNVARDPSEPVCWLIQGEAVYLVGDEREESGYDIDDVRFRVRHGEWVPSKWLPYGVTYNPADPDHKPLEVTHAPDVATCDWEVGMFLTAAALDVLIALLDATQKAPESVRKHFSRPSECDLAIVQRVYDMLHSV